MKHFFVIPLITLFLINSIFIVAKEYKGAEYRTKEAFTYGRFEVNMKSCYREGMLSSFFTYYDEGGPWNEIDIEIIGRYENDFQMNTITPGQTNHVGRVPLNFNPHQEFHTYAFEWTPQYVSWFVDGVEVLKQTGPHIETLTLPQKIMMNIWNPQQPNWVGTFYPEALPAFAYYDWVSYYSYTPGTGSYGTENNFTHSWTDNFDSWDTTRWDKATHTFSGNGCDFVQANAVFNDGKLVLCLTNNTNLGFVDVKAPSILSARGTTNQIEVVFSEEVDPVTSQNIQNYIITGVTINNAQLQNDLRTVILNVSGLDLNTTKNVIATGIKDLATPPNTASASLKTIYMVTSPLVFPLKINCGGFVALDFTKDTLWLPTTEYGYLDGSATSPGSISIGGTDEDEIYQSERAGSVLYKFRVPNGNYKVKLMFAENYYSNAGQRIFDVYLENNKVIQNLDIYDHVGKNFAYETSFENIIVNDGILDIYFGAIIGQPVINGIVITALPSDVENEYGSYLMQFKLEQNYPNPFNNSTVIEYSLTQRDEIFFSVYNILGEQIFYDYLGDVDKGIHQYFFNASDMKDAELSSGVYLYSIRGTSFNQSKKFVLLK